MANSLGLPRMGGLLECGTFGFKPRPPGANRDELVTQREHMNEVGQGDQADWGGCALATLLHLPSPDHCGQR